MTSGTALRKKTKESSGAVRIRTGSGPGSPRGKSAWGVVAINQKGNQVVGMLDVSENNPLNLDRSLQLAVLIPLSRAHFVQSPAA
jgi:hypothetical protein